MSGNREKAEFWNWGKGLTVVILLFVVTTLGVVFYLVSLDFYLVSEDHYQEAVEYQEQIDRIEQSKELSSPVQVAALTSGEIEIRFPSEVPYGSIEGTIRLYRPSDSQLDRTYRLKVRGEGVQRISTEGLKRGQWLVQITWQADGGEYYREHALFLEP